MTTQIRQTRRGFMASALGAGGALVVGLRAEAAGTDPAPWAGDAVAGAQDFTPWLSIDPDGTVSVMVAHPDIGNGVLTQAVSFVHEELVAPWETYKAVYAPPERNHQLGGVFSAPGGILAYFSGRSTADERRIAYMTAGATAREMLRAGAAAEWGVEPSAVTLADGVLTGPAGQSAPMGTMLAQAAAAQVAEVAPKPREEWTFLGKASPAKIQLPDIVRGRAVYGIDVQMEGKVYAALRQSPVMGGTVKSFDADAVMGMPGVIAVVEVKPTPVGEEQTAETPFPAAVSAIGSAVAVVAEHYWQARTALDALPVEWDDGPGARWDTASMNEAALAAVRAAGEKVELSVGDVEAAFAAEGATVVEAEYLTPYCEQAPMEPLNGTALVTADSVELWHPSQHTQMAFGVAAQQTGLPLEAVRAHQTFVGGGFGRRVFSDDARMVVAVAQQVPGRPVHTIWSREEATRQGRYRPLMAGSMKAALGPDGLPIALLARVSGGPGFFVMGMPDTVLPLVVENAQVESQVVADFHVRTGPYRGPGYNSNIFFVESFVDEMAHAAGQDPMDYRIALYGKWADPAWVKCLEVLRDESGWGGALPEGQARGVAIGNWGMGGQPNAGTTCATVAQVEVTREGALRVLRVDVAFDTGRVMNRDAVETEIVGGVLFGLNMAMNEELTIEAGRIVEGNYDTYPMLRIDEVPPEIHVHWGGLSDGERYTEIGEPPVGPIGPAVANAVFAITGKRMRTQPFRTHDLSWT